MYLLLNISNLYSAYGDYNKAYDNYKTAYELMKKMVIVNPELNIFYMGLLQGNFSITCFQLGKLEESMNHITGSLKIFFTLFNEDEKKYMELIRSHLNQLENILKENRNTDNNNVLINLVTLALLIGPEPCFYLGKCLFNSNYYELAESILTQGILIPENMIQEKFEVLLDKIHEKN